MTSPAFPTGTILGYPRIGRRREIKRAVEAFWAGRIPAEELERVAADTRESNDRQLVELGLNAGDSSVPGGFSYYDHVLDAAVTVGAVPTRFERFLGADGAVDLTGYFAIARGDGDDLPAEMTKWFDTNYHYLVPEIGPETRFRFTSRRIVDEFVEARARGILTRPVIVGPVTFLLLSKPSADAPHGYRPLDRLNDLLPVYAELLRELHAVGAEWIQLDEPGLVSESLSWTPQDLSAVADRAYRELGAIADRPQLFIAAGYGSLDDVLPALLDTPVEAIGLDLVTGDVPTGLRTDRTLVGGVVDGRNIWRGDLDRAIEKLTALQKVARTVAVATSTSLLHTPHDVGDEPALSDRLRSWLAFADQKVVEVSVLARGLVDGPDSIADEVDAASAALADRRSAPGVRDGDVRTRAAELDDSSFSRGDYAHRLAAQNSLSLPFLPTTTIGSFPQTGAIRAARAARASGRVTEEEYTDAMRSEIREVIALQERIGLDVLVHGEPERNDMVQYFAEHLDGFAVTQNGWVQSYGSRCTRPSILWGDVSRPAPITVAWSTYAQQLTARPVKGMLTGPVTILAWSFVRDDQPLGETANQVALALRDEIGDLEEAGIRIVQVDEPALRELLPLKRDDQADYLEWSVDAFRLATSGAADTTQIHTHLCYSEFGVVIDAIDQLDADVTSIEAARSKMEVVPDIARSGFARGIGPGVYDIHSPRVPSVAEVTELIETALGAIPERQVWVNPDCGLKTRAYEETVASLTNLVEATRIVREGRAS